MNPLIAAAALAGRLAGPHPPLILDVRYRLGAPRGAAGHRQGHVPGAVFVHLEDAFSGAPGRGGRHPLPDTETFQTAMRAAGVSAKRPVVVYDTAESTPGAAARAWWCLRYFGHGDVRILDGGLDAWKAGAYRIDVGDVPPERGDFEARPGGLPVIDAAAVVRLVERGGILIDARAAERFRGEVEPIDPVAGHIPGASNLPVTSVRRDDHRYLPHDEMRRTLLSAGATDQLVVGAYCGSGIQAAEIVVAAATVGIDVGLYAGSWSEWITDPTRPVATGNH